MEESYEPSQGAETNEAPKAPALEPSLEPSLDPLPPTASAPTLSSLKPTLTRPRPTHAPTHAPTSAPVQPPAAPVVGRPTMVAQGLTTPVKPSPQAEQRHQLEHFAGIKVVGVGGAGCTTTAR